MYKKSNGFLIFATQRRKQLRNQGTVFRKFEDLLDYISPEWQNLPPHKKENFKAQAKAKDQVQSDQKVAENSWDIEQVEDERTEDTEKLAQLFGITTSEMTYEAIDHLLETGGDIKNTKFILIHTNAYCGEDSGCYIPAELGVCALTLKQGIIDNYWVLVDPGGPISDGLGSEIYDNSDHFQIPMPSFEIGVYDEDRPKYFKDMVTNLNLFVCKNDNPWKGVDEKTIVYCLTRDMKKVGGCIDWIYNKAETKKSFKILPYERLVLALYDFGRLAQANFENTDILPVSVHIKESVNQRKAYDFCHTTFSGELMEEIRGSSKEPLTFDILGMRIDEDQLDYLSNQGIFLHEKQVEIFSHFGKYFGQQRSLACLYHQVYDQGIHYCSLHTVNRQACIILEHLASKYGVIVEKGLQRPGKASWEKEKRKFLLAKWNQYGYS